jgi:hypothetical protein
MCIYLLVKFQPDPINGLRDMHDLAKLVSKHLKAEFEPDLDCIIYSRWS